MDFFIVTSDSKLFEFDKEKLDAISPANITRHGLVIDSGISDFKNNKIILVTIIEIGRVKEGTINIAEPEKLLTFKGKTVFQLSDPSLFTSGVTDHAVSVMESMITLCQAHAYGAFNITVREMNLPRLPMEVSPVEKYLEAITDFLSSQIE